MDLKQIRDFLAVYEEGSFSKAAERENRTQPRLSVQISAARGASQAAFVRARCPWCDADGEFYGTHPVRTPGRAWMACGGAQAVTPALDCWFAFQLQGSRPATLLAG
jgi:hypothetical protein